MKPPEPSAAGRSAKADGAAPAVLPCLPTLKHRKDFLRCARGRRLATPAFILQANRRAEDVQGGAIRAGFTCSKKVGNAVRRNRAKRRLRALARSILPHHGRSGWDYVLIGRAEVTATRPFAAMQEDLKQALARLHETT